MYSEIYKSSCNNCKFVENSNIRFKAHLEALQIQNDRKNNLPQANLNNSSLFEILDLNNCPLHEIL